MILFAFFFLLSWSNPVFADVPHQKQFIFDNANLLTEEQITELEALSEELSMESETALIILTADGMDGKVIEDYMGDFYDEEAPGYEQPHGNTAILTIDMETRDFYLTGFKKAEIYLNDDRLDEIRDIIVPSLRNGDYFQAFSTFIELTHDFMLTEPENEEVDPAPPNAHTNNNTGGESDSSYNNRYTKEVELTWIDVLVASIVLSAIIVGIMLLFNRVKIKVNPGTYLNRNSSGVLQKRDQFVRQTVTKVKKPSNNSNNNSGGGFSSGGGITRGGHSHSGSKGKF